MGETPDSLVDQRFGRTRYFILFDTENNSWSAHSNDQNLNAMQGAGIQAGQKVIDLGAETLITGHCGPKAFAVLSAGAVAVCTDAKGTVCEAIDAFKNGDLKTNSGPNVESHFGSA